MTEIDALKQEIRDLEKRIARTKGEVAKISADFSESNDELAQLHLTGKPVASSD